MRREMMRVRLRWAAGNATRRAERRDAARDARETMPARDRMAVLAAEAWALVSDLWFRYAEQRRLDGLPVPVVHEPYCNDRCGGGFHYMDEPEKRCTERPTAQRSNARNQARRTKMVATMAAQTLRNDAPTHE